MREADAKEKICPLFGSGMVLNQPIDSREQNVHDGANWTYAIKCKGSNCMWWRWNKKSENNGYCGVAGKEKHDN